MSKWENNKEIQFFREYLRIPTVQPNVNYGKKESYFRFYIFIGTFLNLRVH